MPSTQQLTALFKDAWETEQAIVWLHGHGYEDAEIDIVTRDSLGADPAEKPLDLPEDQALQHAFPMMKMITAIGAAAVLAGIFIVAVPMGLAATWPLVLLLASVGAVGAVGILGALAGTGISRDNAQRYADEIEHGATLLTITPHKNDEQAVRHLFAQANGPLRAQV